MILDDIILGSALEILKTLPDSSVQCCITSPPYWGLRDYGVDGQLGLEGTPEEYVSNMVEIFSEVRRVLNDDGTLWLNLGDSYAGHTSQASLGGRAGFGNRIEIKLDRVGENLKPKDLVGIPWRVAFALQASGWYLRQDIIWHKPNPMPESVTDRCTKAHEYLFLMSKSMKYYYDHEAIKEPASPDTHARYARGRSDTHKNADGGPGNQTIAKSFEHMRPAGVNPKVFSSPSGWDKSLGAGGHNKNTGRYPKSKQNASFSAAVKDVVGSRNKRSVWAVPSYPYPEAHFATYPPDLIIPCILAGSSEGDIILDPFMGAGTTAIVALRARRHYIGIELNPEYIELANKRIDPLKRQGNLI